MYKNFRVGKVKYYRKATNQAPPMIMVQVLEWCGTRWSSYHLWISVSEKFEVTFELVGSWVLVGFYMKSYVDKQDKQPTAYNTALRMRHLESFKEEYMETVIVGDEEFIDEDDSISAPAEAIDVAKQIYQGTTYQPDFIPDGV